MPVLKGASQVVWACDLGGYLIILGKTYPHNCEDGEQSQAWVLMGSGRLCGAVAMVHGRKQEPGCF